MSDPVSSPGRPSALQPALPAWAIISPARLQHVQRVAELVSAWAARMGVADGERERWLRAGWLDDAPRGAAGAGLVRGAPSAPGPGELRHGPASAARAKGEGENDRGVLDAVRFHSIGLAEWDMAGRTLYCADFLEPGRSFEPAKRAALAERFPADPGGVLHEVARRRMLHLIESGWRIPVPTLRFWNSLTAASPPR